MIQGHGNSAPSGMFIADGPFGEDLSTNYALSGHSERLLKELCNSSNIQFNNFYCTVLVKEKLPCSGTSNEEIKENWPLVTKYRDILIEEIENLKPQLLIPLGEMSFRFLTGLEGIRKFRGSVLLASATLKLSKPTKVLPILGPYPYLNQEYKLKYISRIDFGKISKYLNDTLPPDNLCNIWIARNSASFSNFLDRSYRNYEEKGGFLVFDIETFMDIPTCISFCFDGYESVCVPLLDISLDGDNRTLMMQSVAKILASPIPKKNQNIKYDWKVLERWGFKVNNVCGDSMIAANCIYPEFPKNLGFLTSIYTDLPYFKDEGRQFDPEKHKKDQFYLYNAKDSLATHQIISQQEDELKYFKVDHIYEKLIQLMPIYRTMEDTGILIDQEERSNLLSKYISLFEIETLKLRRLANNDSLNPLSSKQMNILVFDTLGYTKIRGVKGTDEDSLEILKELGHASRSPIYGKDILQIISNCRKLHRVIEILELPLYPDGRFRCEYNLVGTENGRTSAGVTSDNILYFKDNKIKVTYLGHSLQTIAKHGFSIDGVTYGKDLRNIFVPDPGYIFVEIDSQGAEARVDAVLSGNFSMLSAFDTPTGIHRLTGSWIYNCTPEEIKKGVLVNGIDRYHISKQVRHAAERNITAQGLVTKLVQNISIKEGMRILNTVHEKQPEIRSVFHREVIDCINHTGTLRAPNGRRRDFFDRKNNHLYNEAISFIPQATVSDHMKFSFIEIKKEYPLFRPLVEAHDGVLCLVRKGDEYSYIEKHKKILDSPIDFSKCSLSRDFLLHIPSEASIGEHCWAEMEEVD